MILILCGTTCSGKDTVSKYIPLNKITTYTTRPQRRGEKNNTYHFINEEDFIKLKNEGFFFETTSYTVANGDIWYYGTSNDDLVNNDAVLIANPDGVKKYYNSDIKAMIVLLKSDEQTIKKRLEYRGDKPDEAERRLLADKNDFKDIEKYIDFSILNDGNLSPQEIANIIFDEYKKYKYEYDIDE